VLFSQYKEVKTKNVTKRAQAFASTKPVGRFFTVKNAIFKNIAIYKKFDIF